MIFIFWLPIDQEVFRPTYVLTPCMEQHIYRCIDACAYASMFEAPNNPIHIYQIHRPAGYARTMAQCHLLYVKLSMQAIKNKKEKRNGMKKRAQISLPK